MVKSIYLQDGEEIFVDDEDYERVNQYTWWKMFVGNKKQIASTLGNKIDKRTVYLTSFILGKGASQKTKNNDYRRRNLTNKNIVRYQRAHHTSTSKYKGVMWDKARCKWLASIGLEGKSKFLGRYATEEQAAKAYNQAVIDYWDGDAYLNIIGVDNRLPLKNYKTNKKTHKSRTGKYGYRGIIKTDPEKYRANVWFGGKNNFTTAFTTVDQAALAYNKCAIYLHGDNAILNEVPMTDELKEFIANWEIPDKIKALKEGATSE